MLSFIFPLRKLHYYDCTRSNDQPGENTNKYAYQSSSSEIKSRIPVAGEKNLQLLPFISQIRKPHYHEYIYFNDEPEEKIDDYSYCSRTELYKPISGKDHYSITWTNNKAKVKINEIIFIVKFYSNRSEKDEIIAGVNLITSDQEILKIAKNLEGAKVTSHCINLQPQPDKNRNIPLSSKEFISNVANIFYQDIRDDKEATDQYHKDISCLYFNTLSESEKDLFIHGFFNKPVQTVPKVLRKMISDFAYKVI